MTFLAPQPKRRDGGDEFWQIFLTAPSTTSVDWSVASSVSANSSWSARRFIPRDMTVSGAEISSSREHLKDKTNNYRLIGKWKQHKNFHYISVYYSHRSTHCNPATACPQLKTLKFSLKETLKISVRKTQTQLLNWSKIHQNLNLKQKKEI